VVFASVLDEGISFKVTFHQVCFSVRAQHENLPVFRPNPGVASLVHRKLGGTCVGLWKPTRRRICAQVWNGIHGEMLLASSGGPAANLFLLKMVRSHVLYQDRGRGDYNTFQPGITTSGYMPNKSDLDTPELTLTFPRGELLLLNIPLFLSH
jgi:hypothetical protein